ncbi:hypothetical protein QQP08_009319 [Theobroma cacao]|nr:hypothetical protein QQP08_009319 [Theobroma cacao]
MDPNGNSPRSKPVSHHAHHIIFHDNPVIVSGSQEAATRPRFPSKATKLSWVATTVLEGSNSMTPRVSETAASALVETTVEREKSHSQRALSWSSSPSGLSFAMLSFA